MAVPYVVPKMTYADLAGFPDDGHRYELIEGDLYVSPAPSRWHQRLNGRFYLLLHHAVEVTGWGEVYYAPLDVLFTDDNYVQPDLLVIRKERLDIFHEDRFEGPPDIVIEIVSPSNPSYDEVKKANLYAAFGVLDYWLAYPLTKRFRMMKLENGQYVEVQPVDGVYHSTVVPGLVVDPAALFANLD
ncbi:MAG: Uma2 family endonuclease [Thermomicrobiales bacterium]